MNRTIKFIIPTILMLFLLIHIANAAFIVPSGVIKVINVSLNNQQATAIPANTPIFFTFNGINYNTIFNGNLINYVIFNGITGEVIPSSFEGNQINETQVNGFNGVTNNIQWFLLPNKIAGNTNAINVISIGFYQISATALSISGNTYLAPQIYCASGCPASSYAKFDGEANIFTYYQRWGSLAGLPSGWSYSAHQNQPTVVFAASNIILTAPSSCTNIGSDYCGINVQEPYGANTPGNAIDTLIQYTLLNTGSASEFGVYGSIADFTHVFNYAFWDLEESDSNPPSYSLFSNAINHVLLQNIPVSNPQVYTVQLANTLSANVLANYTTMNTYTLSTFQNTMLGYYAQEISSSQSTQEVIYWTRVRAIPPNGIMPTASFGLIQTAPYSMPASPSLGLSNTLIDQGQTTLFTAQVFNGNNLFSYNYLVTNSITNVIIANMLHTNIANRADIWAWTPQPNLYTSNTFKANVIITEQGGYSNTVNTIYQPIGYNSAMTGISITNVLPTTQLSSNTLTWTTSFSGGTSPYTYSWTVYNSVTNSVLTSQVYSGNIYTSNSFSWTPGSAYGGNTIYAGIAANDAATTSVAISTNSNVISLYSKINSPNIALSNTLIDQGQSELITAFVNSGSPPYTYNYYIVNSITNTVLANQLYTGCTLTTNSFFWTPTSANLGNTLNANIVITDGLANTVNTIYTPIGYNSALIANIVILGFTQIPKGYIETLAIQSSGGTPPFTYNYYNVTGGNYYKPNYWNLLYTPSSNSVQTQGGRNCVSTINSIYCIGFNQTSTNQVTFSQILTNNNLLASQSTTNYPIKTIIPPTCVNNNNYIYCVGGMRVTSINSVYYSKIQSDNTLGTWQQTTDYPLVLKTIQQGIQYGGVIGSCVTGQNNIYCIDGSVQTGDCNTGSQVYYGILTSTGISSWNQGTNLPLGTSSPSCQSQYGSGQGTDGGSISCVSASISSGNYIYCMGGSQGWIPTGFNSTHYVKINNDNSLGTWATTSSLPQLLASQRTGISDQGCILIQSTLVIVCTGGFNQTNGASYNYQGVNYTWYAHILPNGALSSWVNGTRYGVTGVGIKTQSAAPTCLYTNGNNYCLASMLDGLGNGYTGNDYINSYSNNIYSSQNPYSLIALSAIGNTITVNGLITDSASTPVSMNTVSNSFTITQLSAGLGLSNTLIDQGQTTLLTATESYGFAPFTYNFFISNSITNAIIASASYSNIGTVTNTFQFTPIAANLGNTLQANVVITDSNNIVTNSVYTPIGYNSAPTVTIAPLTATYISSGTETWTATVTGGTSNYIYKWTILNPFGGTLSQVSNSLSATTNSYTYSFTQIGNPYLTNVTINDAATTPYITNSIQSTTAVLSSAGGLSVSLTASNTLLDSNQYLILTASVSGGTVPYTYNFYNVTSGSIVNSCGSINVNICKIKINTPTQSNSFSYNVVISDSSVPSNVASTSTVTIGANTAMNIPSITTPTPSTQIVGNTVMFSTSFSGGTSPYTYNWQITNTIDGTILLTSVITNSFKGNTLSWIIPATAQANTFYTNVLVTDSATTPVKFASAHSGTITIPSVTTNTASLTVTNAPVVNINQLEIFSATTYGFQVSPFKYNYQIINSITGTLLGNQIYTSVSSTSNTFVWNVPSIYAGNSFEANVIITDSLSNTINSIYTSPTNIITLTPSVAVGTTIKLGIPFTLTVTSTGSILPLTWNWTVTNAAGNVLANAIYNNVQSTSNSFTFIPNTLGQIIFSYTVNDPGGGSSSYNVITPIYLQNGTTNPALTFNTIGVQGLSTCTANTIGGTCIGNDIISGTNTFKNNLFVIGNITILGGSLITTNGFYISTTGTFNSIGATISTGYIQNINSGGAQSAGAGNNGNNGISFIGSLGGSGGGGGGGGSGAGGNGGSGGYGGNTLKNGGIGGNAGISGNGGNGGNGNTPATTINALNIYPYCSSNSINGGSGGSGGSGAAPTSGSSGQGGNVNSNVVRGVCISANILELGNINANALASFNGGNSGSGGGGSGGGGGNGGGAIILTYINSYTAGTYNVMGGVGGLGGTSANNGGMGGNGASGNVIVLQTSTNPLAGIFQFYPIKIFTNAIIQNGNYTLYQTFNGITTTLISNAQTLSYIPLANQINGVYNYNVLEVENGFTSNYITLNITINMTDISNALTFNNPIIQYYSNLANISKVGFTVLPQSWKLWSYPNTFPANYGINTIQGSVFSSNSVTFPTNIQLNYGFTLFNISLLNNPLVQTTIAQNKFGFNSITNSIYSRNAFSISTFTEPLYTTLNAVSTYSTTATIGNYSTSFLFSTPNFNSIVYYIPSSNFANPIINLTNQNIFSTSANYVGRENNLFSYTLNTIGEAINIYLPQIVNTSTYTISVFGCSGYTLNDTIGVINVGTSPTAQVQLYKMTSIPFVLSLLTQSYPYSFTIYDTKGKLLYVSSSSSPANPLNLYINTGCSSGIPIIKTTNITVLCTSQINGIGQLVATCTGNDKLNLVSSWTVNFLNQSTILTQTVMNSVTITGNHFVTSFTFPSNTQPYYYQVTAFVGNVFDPQTVYSGVLNLLSRKPLNYDLGFAAILLILLPVAFAYFDRSLTLIAEVFVIVLGQAVGIFGFSVFDVTGIIVLCGLLLIMDERNS